MQIDPISYIISYNEILLTLINLNFLFFTANFLLIFLLAIYIFYIPFKFLKNESLWPLIGLSNIILISSFYLSFIYFMKIDYLFNHFLVILLIFWLLEYYFLTKKPKLKIRLPSNKKIIFLYFILVFLIASSSFSLDTRQYFVPGYEVNHDSINILSTIKILENRNLNTDIAMSTNELLDIYPMGGSLLLANLSSIFYIDAYFIYSLTITSVMLLTIFVVYEICKSYLVSVSTVFSYLSISAINAGVMGSTIVVPFVVASIWILSKLKRRFSENNLLLLSLFLYTISSIYGYFTLLYIFIFALFSGTIIYFLIASIPLLLNFHFIYSSTNILLQNLFSLERERSLFLGMTGNQNSFVDLLKTFSLWYSHPNYIINEPKSFNFLFYIILVFLIYSFYKNKNDLSIGLTKTFGIFMLVAYFVTGSYYQFYKVSYQFSFFIPLIIFYILKNNFHRKIVLILMILSGLLTLRFVGVDVAAKNQEIYKEFTDICESEKNISIITSTEWSRYFLIDCKDTEFVMDRKNIENYIAVTEENNISSIAFSCSIQKLTIGEDFFNKDRLLIDKCFSQPISEEYQLTREYTHHKFYEKK